MFDAELEKWQSLFTDSFTEIEHRKEQNQSDDTNPTQVEAEIGEAETELEREREMIEDDWHVFQQRLQTK